MASNEIFECVKESIGWLVLGGAGYLALLFGSQALDYRSSLKRIESQKELDGLLVVEANKLGLDASLIDAKFNWGKITGVRKTMGKYEMQFSYDFPLTLPKLRHELYHTLKDADKYEDREMNLLYYLFIAEPRATLYGTFGIKF